MQKTTIYLPADLKDAVSRAARLQGVSEAELIRESLRAHVAAIRPVPHAALFQSQEPFAENADSLLAGFGDR